MIIDNAVHPKGSVTGVKVDIDADRFAWVGHFDDAFLVSMANGEGRTNMALTPEAAWALWWALTGALSKWGGECPLPEVSEKLGDYPPTSEGGG
jgi:hypothetical protein